MRITYTKKEDVPAKSWEKFMQLVDGQLKPEVISAYLVTTSSVFPRIELGATREAMEAAKIEAFYEFGGDDEHNKAYQELGIRYDGDAVSGVEYRLRYFDTGTDKGGKTRTQAAFDALKERLTTLLGKRAPGGKPRKVSWEREGFTLELAARYSQGFGGWPLGEIELTLSRV
jgi:hypothetical protein